MTLEQLVAIRAQAVAIVAGADALLRELEVEGRPAAAEAPPPDDGGCRHVWIEAPRMGAPAGRVCVRCGDEGRTEP